MEVRAAFISKAGRSSNITPNDFRPISPSLVPVKTLERIMDLYIKEKTRIVA